MVAKYGFIYSKLDEVNARVPDGAVCVMDSAFSSIGRPYVLKLIQAHIRAENSGSVFLLVVLLLGILSVIWVVL
jgi:hypothetical protein